MHSSSGVNIVSSIAEAICDSFACMIFHAQGLAASSRSERLAFRDADTSKKWLKPHLLTCRQMDYAWWVYIISPVSSW